MKTFMITLIVLMGLSNAASFGVNPIPSYDVLVHQYANFQEQGKSFGSQRLTRGKRKMVIHSTCGGTKTGCTCNVWVYSLDGLTTLGPFTLVGDDRVYVDIDEREWGVLVESSDKVCIDVWIEESKATENWGLNKSIIEKVNNELLNILFTSFIKSSI